MIQEKLKELELYMKMQFIPVFFDIAKFPDFP